MGGARIALGRGGKCFKILVGKRKGKISFERRRRRWKNIAMDHKETGSGVVDLIYLTEDTDQWRALLNTIFPKMLEFLY
jgi:hypothetical protein